MRTRLKRSYDLRWIYPDQVNEDIYQKLGQFFAWYLEWKTIAVWHDARSSSPSLKEAMIKGLIVAGKNVVDIGLCSTDMSTFASGYYDDIDGCVMITASHNPPEYNGLKICKNKAMPVNIKKISKQIINFLESEKIIKSNITGAVTQRNIVDDRVKHILGFVESHNIKPLKIVIDAGNGTAGVFLTKLFEKLNCDIVPMYFEPKGIPEHEANPMKAENVQDMINKVQEVGADLGVAFDGDADRVMICDETGTMLTGTIITAAIAEKIAKLNPGCKVMYNTVVGKVVHDTIKKHNCIPVRSKVGHVYIKEIMNKDSKILFAWEHSAHYFFRSNWNADSWIIALMIVLELFSSKREKVSEMRAYYDNYIAIPETNFTIHDPDPIYKQLKKEFASGTFDENDGLLIEFSDAWLNVRPSSNEPLLRLNLEAVDEAILERYFERVKTIIEQHTDYKSVTSK